MWPSFLFFGNGYFEGRESPWENNTGGGVRFLTMKEDIRTLKAYLDKAAQK